MSLRFPLALSAQCQELDDGIGAHPERVRTVLRRLRLLAKRGAHPEARAHGEKLPLDLPLVSVLPLWL